MIDAQNKLQLAKERLRDQDSSLKSPETRRREVEELKSLVDDVKNF